MTDLKNKLEEVWIQRGSFGYVVVKDKDSNPEWINRPIQVCSVSILYTLQQELQKTREQLGVAEAVLSVQCTDSALAYFKDKQGE